MTAAQIRASARSVRVQSPARWVNEVVTPELVDLWLAQDRLDLVVIRGGTGLGKSWAVAQAVSHLTHVLVTTHLIALVEQNAKLFGCRSYNDPTAKGGPKTVLLTAPRASTTLQSVHHARGREFARDVLVIDEVEQAFRRVVTGDHTPNERDARSRADRWRDILEIMGQVRLTIAMDAYATQETLEMIAREAGLNPARCALLEFTAAPPRGVATRMQTRDDLREAIATACSEPTMWAQGDVKQGAVFVACTTKGAAIAHATALRALHYRVLLWYSATKEDPDVQAWARHPQRVSRGTVYDAVVASPSITTGLSLGVVRWPERIDDAEYWEVRAVEMANLLGEDIVCVEGALTWPMFRTVAHDGQMHALHMDDSLQAIARVREARRLLWWMDGRAADVPPTADELANATLARYAKTRASAQVPGVQSPAEAASFRSLARAAGHFQEARLTSMRFGGIGLAQRLAGEGWRQAEAGLSADAEIEDYIEASHEARVTAILAAPLPPHAKAPQSEWQTYLATTSPATALFAEDAKRFQALLGIQGKHTRDNALSQDVAAVRWLCRKRTKAERAVRIGMRAARLALDEAVYADYFELAGRPTDDLSAPRVRPYSPEDATHHVEGCRLAIDGMHRAGINMARPWSNEVHGASLWEWMHWSQIRARDLRKLLDCGACTAVRAGDRPRSFRAFVERIGFRLVQTRRGQHGAPTCYRVWYDPVVERALQRRGFALPDKA